MKFDVFVNEDNVVYMATKDIANFFDEDIFYDNDLDDKKTQTNKDILMYVVKNNNKIYSSTIFSAYINEKVGIEWRINI